MRAKTAEPMDLGDIVSAAWLLCARHWQPLLLMALLTFAASMLTNLGLLPLAAKAQPAVGGHVTLPHVPLALAPLLAVGALVLLFNQLAFMRYGLEVWVEGQATVVHAYLRAARSFLTALGGAAIVSLVCAVGFATWLGIPIAIYFLVCWFFVGQICLAEGESNPLRALGRSRAIVRGNWWRSAGVLAGVTLLALLPSIIVDRVPTDSLEATLLLSGLATASAAPFLAAAQTSLYLDLRVRKHESISLAPSKPTQPV